MVFPRVRRPPLMIFSEEMGSRLPPSSSSSSIDQKESAAVPSLGGKGKRKSEQKKRYRRTFNLNDRKERKLTPLVTYRPGHVSLVSHARTHNFFGFGFALAVVLIDAHFMGGGVLDGLALALVKCTGGIARGLVAQGRAHVVVTHCVVAGIESE